MSRTARVLLTTITICLCSPLLLGQQQLPRAPNIPQELQALNPDVRAKLAAARSDSETGKYDEAFKEDQQALDVAKRAGFSGDIALAEDTLASAEFISGRVQPGWSLDRDALQKAIDSSNFVLQADILTSLSSYSQSAGNMKGALSLLAQALDAAEKSKSLYIKSRVLGEMGRLQLLVGEKDNAKKSLDEALRIDSLNNYSFRSLHLVYQAYFLLSDNQTLKEGIQELEKARDAAISARNYLALVLAESALGTSYIHIGEIQRGIGILQAMSSGDIKVGNGAQVIPSEFRPVLELPFVRISFLEALGNAYEAAKQPTDAISAWLQLYSFSNGIGLTQGIAEAAQHLGNLYSAKGDNETAVRYYRVAVGQWQTTGNDALLVQSLIGEAACLMKAGRSVEALPIEDELKQIAIRLKNRRLEFLAYLAMAEIDAPQPANQTEQARTALEKAQALIEPGPGDATIDYKSVSELYLRLAMVYGKLGDQEEELAAIEKAAAVNIAAKDQKQVNAFVAALRQKFDTIHVEDLISNLYKSGKLFDALKYSQLLYGFQGIPPGFIPPGKGPLYWRVVTKVPFQIAVQQGGGQELEQDLGLMGPILGFEKWPILQALSEHYVFSGTDAEQFERGRDYAQQALALVDQTKNLLSPQGMRIYSICTLAAAYARTKKLDLANQTIQSCLDLEKQSNDPEAKNLVNFANLYVHMLDNDISAARESLSFLIKNGAATPIFDEELAMALGHGGHIPDAMSEFAVVLRAYGDRKDTGSVARCYKEMASVLDSSTSPDSKKKELQFLNDALNLYQRAGDTFQESGTDFAIGQYFGKIGNTRNAERYFQQGLQAAERSENQDAVGLAYGFLANLYDTKRQRGKALPLYAKAAAAFAAANNDRMEAEGFLAAGLDMQVMGRLDEALTSFFKAQALADESGDSSSQYSARIDIGGLYEQNGQLGQARTAYVNAAEIAKSNNDLGNLARSDMDLAELDDLEGDWQGAVEQTMRARTIFQQIGNRDSESDADSELAAIYSDRESSIRDFDLARKYMGLAQKLHYSKRREFDDIEIDIQMKKYSEAAAIAKDILSGCRQEKDTVCLASGLVSLAEAERLSGELDASDAALREAQPLVRKNQDIYLRGRLLYGEANQARTSGHFRSAVGFYEKTIDLIDEAKENIDPQLQLSMSDTYDFVYDELIDCLYSLSEQERGSAKLQTAIEALGYAEANKARQFEKSWGQTFVSELRNKLPLDVVQQEDVLNARRSQLAAELRAAISGADSSSGSPAQLQGQLARAESDLQNFVHMLQRKYPAYAALEYPEPTSLASIPLRPSETLVEFKMTDAATFVWIIRGDPAKGNSLISFYKVPEQRAWFDSRIYKLRDAFNSGQPEGYDPELSQELFDKLFPAKQAEAILDSHHLIFVPDDVLYLLPFEILSPHAGQGKYALLSVPTAYFPSAESLRIARTGQRSEQWKEAFLGVGDPITSPSDPRYPLVAALSLGGSAPSQQKPVTVPQSATNQVDKLKARGFEFDRIPGTAKEIQSIANLFSEEHESADILLGVNATRKDVLDLDLSQFRYIHFATHGILPVDAGVREPSLVLSYDGTTADHMLLPISTIMRLNIDADDVVLSACNTGSGQVTRAEGVMSLGRAFMTAGASSVTVSLWEVSDASTALLMKQYYGNLLLGKSKDEALADARTWLFQNGYRQPYSWAPFILIGE